jgi:hypothetical protein
MKVVGIDMMTRAIIKEYHIKQQELQSRKATMTKKEKDYGLQVHTLTFLKVDENGESIDGKQYEYTGDHSGFCDGIENEYLKEVEVS